MLTDPIIAAIEGCQEAQELIAKIRRGDALPDELLMRLQAMRLAGDGERLRAFVRAVQKSIGGRA